MGRRRALDVFGELSINFHGHLTPSCPFQVALLIKLFIYLFPPTPPTKLKKMHDNYVSHYFKLPT
jgi:hypothetical protein